jgi:diguanylate cyclase (GGDEF)-like protein/PAS domain S-box-containing protein
MQAICERTQELTGAESASIFLFEHDAYAVKVATGFMSAELGADVPLEGTLCGWVHRHQRAALVTDASVDARVHPLARERGVRSIVAVPLRHGEEVVGQLLVHSPRTAAFTEEDASMLELLSVVLSGALSHAREYEAKRAQIEALGRFRTLFEAAPIGIVRCDARGRLVEVNAEFERMLGYTAAEVAAISFVEYTHPDDVRRNLDWFDELLQGERASYQIETRYVRKDGELIWVRVSAALERDADGRPAYAVSMIENITERRLAEEELRRQAELNEHQALHDALTGLPNRTLFHDRIEQAIAAASRENSRVAVMMMDLDRFKEVNDTLGHQAGDALLAEIGERLRGAVRGSDTVARLGGDEFGILLPGQADDAGVLAVIERIHEAVEQPIVLQGLPLGIEASLGVAFFPQDGSDVDTILRRADLAMYTAKDTNAPHALYEQSSDHHDPTRLTLVGELRRAIEERELVLHFQPKASLASGEVRSVEALLRWNHPTRGLVFPDQFIPLAQQTGLIKPLTLYVIDEALRQWRAWDADGLALPIAVNLSMRNLLDASFPDDVARLVASRGVDPGQLELEITESTMLADPVRAKAVLERLAAMGFRLAIDDFGTGYSSLAYLKRLPVDEIKIDRSFVMNMNVDEDDAIIVRSTIDLGRNLGLEVVAEGVETREIWERLGSLGCTIAQGDFLSRPVPAEELGDWLRDRVRAAARLSGE